jgi:hypothetical protein
MSLLAADFSYGTSDHAAYREHGYWIRRQALSRSGLSVCRQGVDAAIEQLHPGVSPEEIISAHQVLPWLFDLAAEPAILDLIERQIGRDILLWSTHLLCKPPHTGAEVPWHQDAPYWNVGGPFPGAVWITLDEITQENGAMSVLPGWHDRGVLPRSSPRAGFFHQEIDPAQLPPDVSQRAVTYLLPAGAMAVHDPMIPHTSMPNRSSRYRRVIILRYMTPQGARGEKVYTHPFSGEPMPREYYLMRGVDQHQPGARAHPVYRNARLPTGPAGARGMVKADEHHPSSPRH